MAAVFGVSSHGGLPMTYTTSHSPLPAEAPPLFPPNRLPMESAAGGSYCYAGTGGGVAATGTTADHAGEPDRHRQHRNSWFEEAVDDGYEMKLLNFGAEQEFRTSSQSFLQTPITTTTTTTTTTHKRKWDNGRKLQEKIAHARVKIGFRTKSQVDIIDDGYKWRKYGKKTVKNSPNPRNYYKCSSEGCCVKKRVERDCADATYVITTYEGSHNHMCPTDSARHYGNAPSTAVATAAAAAESPSSYHSSFQSSFSSSSYHTMTNHLNPTNTWNI